MINVERLRQLGEITRSSSIVVKIDAQGVISQERDYQEKSEVGSYEDSCKVSHDSFVFIYTTSCTHWSNISPTSERNLKWGKWRSFEVTLRATASRCSQSKWLANDLPTYGCATLVFTWGINIGKMFKRRVESATPCHLMSWLYLLEGLMSEQEIPWLFIRFKSTLDGLVVVQDFCNSKAMML